MNQYDTGIIEKLVQNKGHQTVSSVALADYVIVNTCSVRAHAETRAMARIAQLKKEMKGSGKLIVVGCMAQRQGMDLVRGNSAIDMIFGTGDYRKIPEYFDHPNERLKTGTDLSGSYDYSEIIPFSQNEIVSNVAIMRGCNNYCSYCIVPYVRGREISRPEDDIINEIKHKINSDTKEIILLGQNVNSYRGRHLDFPNLLRQINNLQGSFRVKFLTSHPKDLSNDLIAAIGECGKVCNHLHLPIQSGSNAILQRMNRGYTREDLFKLVDDIRAGIPGISITTDIIVGFPGESEKDFVETIDMIQKLRFDEAFTYQFSPRAGTKAYEFPDRVTDVEKKRRLSILISAQRKITEECLERYIGKTVGALVIKESTRNSDEMFGSTHTCRPLIIKNPDLEAGKFVKADISFSTGGTLVSDGRGVL